MAGKKLTISRIKLHNFRPYQDVELDLSQDPNKTMTIICGNNSRGKTAIMNAIHWTLYGDEPFWMNGGVGKPIINQNALNNTRVNESTDAWAMVEFSDDEGPKITITRKIFARRETESKDKKEDPVANGQVDAGFSFYRTCDYQERKYDGSWLAADDEQEIDGYVQKFLPQGISQFVIFNGEMLDKFFRAESAKNIREGIENVSGLAITKEAIDHSSSLVAQFSKKEAKDAGSQATQKHAQKESAEEIQNQHKAQQEIDKKKLDELEIKEEKLKTELEKFPEAKLETLKNLLEESKINKKNLEELQIATKEKRINLIIPNLSKLLMKDLLSETKEILRESELRKETPPVVMPMFIDQKIEEGTCMCGRKLDEKSTRELNLLKESVQNAELTDIANEGKLILSKINRELQNLDLKNELKNLHEKMNKYEDELRQTDAKITSLLNTLKEHKIEDVKEIADKLKELLFAKSQLKTQIDQREVRIQAAQITIDRYQEEIDQLGKISNAGKLWITKRKLAEKIRDTLSDLRQDVLSEIRKNVEKRTEELWTGLIARGSEIEKVLIDKDYNIRVIDKDGSDSLKSLSAGQTLYLALSFIAAIRDATDTNYPMIIDSPFGKIDGPSREEAAKTMPKYIPETQVTLLVTDSEYYATIKNDETGEEYPPIGQVLKNEKRIWKVENLTLEKISDTSSKTVLLAKRI